MFRALVYDGMELDRTPDMVAPQKDAVELFLYLAPLCDVEGDEAFWIIDDCIWGMIKKMDGKSTSMTP